MCIGIEREIVPSVQTGIAFQNEVERPSVGRPG
jgi:hypothetical protein